MSESPDRPHRRFPATLSGRQAATYVMSEKGGGCLPPPDGPRWDTPVQRTSFAPADLPDAVVLRRRMVNWLHEQGIRNEAVLTALDTVPRHRFLDSALASHAYEDTSLPIGLNQTISKPSVVARMLEWLLLGDAARRLGHLGHVLEVGTGCGYQTALLTQLSRSVVSIERLRPLFEQAGRQLKALDLDRAASCRLIYGDGTLGAAAYAPFDSIVVAAGGDAVPQAWLDQLSIGGRLIAPSQLAGVGHQVLLIVDRTAHGWHTTMGEAVQFVPLKSGIA